MKKYMTLIMALAVIFCLMSCSESSDSLSESTVKSLVKKELRRLNKVEGTLAIQVGFFECNDDATRLKYRKLAANEIVTYKCEPIKRMERVKKTRQVTRYFWGRYYTDKEHYWTNEEVTHYFVTIELTEKGKKLVVEEKEAEPTDDEKDLKLDQEFDRSKFPEANVNEDEFAKPEEKAEVIEEPAPESQTNVDTNTVAMDSVAIEDTPIEPQPVAKAEPNKSAYDQAKEREQFDVVMLKGFEIKLVKARNIIKTGDYSAKGEIVAEYDEVNAVGRIFGDLDEGRRFLMEDLKFIYYQDKGWQLEKDR